MFQTLILREPAPGSLGSAQTVKGEMIRKTQQPSGNSPVVDDKNITGDSKLQTSNTGTSIQKTQTNPVSKPSTGKMKQPPKRYNQWRTYDRLKISDSNFWSSLVEIVDAPVNTRINIGMMVIIRNILYFFYTLLKIENREP